MMGLRRKIIWFKKSGWIFYGLGGFALCVLTTVLWLSGNPPGGDDKALLGPERSVSVHGSKSDTLARSRVPNAPRLSASTGASGADDAEWSRWWERAREIRTPEEAAAFLGALKDDVSNISLRQSLGASVIRRLVENGHGDAAWKLIDPTYGGIRNAQVRGFFEGLSDQEQRINYFHLIDDEDDKMSALGGILQKMGVANLEKLSDLPLKWDSAAKSALANQVAFAFDVPGELRNDLAVAKCAEDAVDSLMKLFQAGIIDEGGVELVIDSNNYYDASKIIEILDSLSRIKEVDLISCYEKAIGENVVEDSSRAMKVALDKKNMPSLVGVAVSRYYMYDSSGAVQWFSNSSSRMTPDQFDAGAFFFFNQAIQNSEIDSAQAWADSLKSAKLREEANGKIKLLGNK